MFARYFIVIASLLNDLRVILKYVKLVYHIMISLEYILIILSPLSRINSYMAVCRDV